MRASFADIAGARTRFFHHGGGDYGVVLIHGVGVGADSWLGNVEALGQERIAVAPDLLGYGLTGEGSYREGPPHETMLDHLADLSPPSAAALPGWKLLRREYRVPSGLSARLAHGRLVLVGCGPALNSPTFLHAMYQQSLANGIAAMADPTLERCERRMRNLVFDPATIPPALPLIQLTLYGLPGTRERYERRIRGIMSMEALLKYDVTSRLHEITAPTLVIWGREESVASSKRHNTMPRACRGEKCWSGTNAAIFLIWKSRRSSTPRYTRLSARRSLIGFMASCDHIKQEYQTSANRG